MVEPHLALAALFVVCSVRLLGRVANGIDSMAAELRRLRVIAEASKR